MGFREDLREMIDENYEPSRWKSCGRQDDICESTHFVIATIMPNTGIMCGGDGCEFGEWAWFNDVNDMIDYVTNLVIPINLCDLEEQDHRPVMVCDSDEHIFDLPFTEKCVPIKDELHRLWKELRDLKETGATFQQVETALLESDKRSREIDGEFVFGFMCFSDYKSACKKLLDRMLKTDENRVDIVRIAKSATLNPIDAELLAKILFESYIM